MSDPTSLPPPRHRWPGIALIAVVIFFIAWALFMAKEARRVQRIRIESEDLRQSILPTNPPPAPPVK